MHDGLLTGFTLFGMQCISKGRRLFNENIRNLHALMMPFSIHSAYQLFSSRNRISPIRLGH